MDAPRPHEDALQERWTLQGTIPLGGVGPGATWHRARSVATGEQETLLVVEGETALETADAARRAYLVQNPRLMEVRDVVVFGDPRGNDEDPEQAEPLTVVVYPRPAAPPLASLLSQGRLHPETARSVIGEAAEALEVARRRGIRHQKLDSNRIFVDTSDGTVQVLGVGVEAAAAGLHTRSGALASFHDTSALVSLLYRALTGVSPSRGEDGTVARASSLTGGGVIPEDLDVVCDLVLNENADSIPETTRDLIAALEPWQSIPVTLEAYGSRDQRATAAEARDAAAAKAPADAASTGAATAATGTESGRTGTDSDETGQRPEPDQATPEQDGTSPTSPSSAAPSPTSPSPSPAPDHSSSESGEDDTAAGTGSSAGAVAGAAAALDVGGSAAAPAAAASHADPETAGSPRSAAPQDPFPDAHSRDAKGLVEDLHLTERRNRSAFPGHLSVDPSASTPPAASGPDAEAPDEADDGAAALGGAMGGAAGAAGAAMAAPHTQPAPDEDPTTDPNLAPQPSAEELAAEGPIVVRGRSRPLSEDPDGDSATASTESRGSLFRDVVGIAMDQDETYAMSAGRGSERSRHTQWILIGALLLVILAMVLAMTSITSGLRDRIQNPLATTASSPPPTSAEESESPSPTPTEERTTKKDLPSPEIEGATVIAEGGEPDHTEWTDRLIDGSENSRWASQLYGSADYAGRREGMGVEIKLEEKSEVKAVVVTTAVNSGGKIELREDDDGSPGKVLASGEFAGDGDVRLEPDDPIETDSVIVWIPELPSDQETPDRWRARIAEIAVE